MSDPLWPHGLYSPWNSPGLNTGVGSLSLLWGIFPAQELNAGLQLSHQGRPRMLVWVSHPFSRASSRPRNQTGVARIAGRFFTSWATRESSLGIDVINKEQKLTRYYLTQRRLVEEDPWYIFYAVYIDLYSSSPWTTWVWTVDILH